MSSALSLNGSGKSSRASADRLTPSERSANMRAVRGKDTAPEMIVRRMLFRAGFRYRLHCADLPGKPDLVLRKHRAVIFVHGCFWHQHKNCARATLPTANADFWAEKLERNAARDAGQIAALETAGWRVLVVWQCETKDAASLRLAIMSFLDA